MKLTRYLFPALLIVLLASCVSKGKYLVSQAHISNLQNDSANTHHLLSNCNDQVGQLQTDKNSLQSRLGELEYNISGLKDSTNRSKLTIAEQRKRLDALENLIQSQRDVMNRLRKSIADALVNFKPDELSVYIKDGKIYVSLEEKLLFKSGSAVVNPQGREALAKLAVVLNTTSDITVQAEGHTDSVPIHNAQFIDNWALSTGRATSIVRILTNDYGVDPHRVIASGRSKYEPIQTNETDAGRASNRRTEIILSPNLSELYKLLAQ